VNGVTADDGIRAQTIPSVLSKLKPVSDPNRSTTADNSAQMTDGTAAILLTTRAHDTQLPILGVYRSFQHSGGPTEHHGGWTVAIYMIGWFG